MTLDRDRTREFWDRQVSDPRYETDFGPGTLLRNRRLALLRRETEERRFARWIALPPQGVAVDVGCGTGRWALFFAPRVKHVIAIDSSPAMIDRARELAAALGVTNIEFLVRDATALTDLPSVDLIHAGGLLQYLSDEDVQLFARRARTRLATGGRLVSRDSVGRRRVMRNDSYPVIYRTEAEYRRLLGTAGLSLEFRARACFVPELLPKLMPLLPLSGSALRAAVTLDGVVMRLWPVPLLVWCYHWLTGRGSGLVLDHRFAVWRPVAEW